MLRPVWGSGTSDLAPSGDYQVDINNEGWSNSLNGNTITVTGGDTINSIYGAFFTRTREDYTGYPDPPSPPDVVSGNKIFFRNGTQNAQGSGNIYGALFSVGNISPDITALVTDNLVHISGGTLNNAWIVGADAGVSGISGDAVLTASGNEVIIEGDVTLYSLVGTRVSARTTKNATLTASDTKVTIGGRATVTWDLVGGYVKTDDGNVETLTITVSNNTVTLEENAQADGGIRAAWNQVVGSVNPTQPPQTINVRSENNTVYLKDQAEVTRGGIIGATGDFVDVLSPTEPTADITIEAFNNKVVIEGGKAAGTLFGATFAVASSRIATVDVSHNEVIISGGEITSALNAVCGGYGTVNGATETANVAVRGNKVDISGDAAITGNVYGGRALFWSEGIGEVESVFVTDNIVTISGTPTFTNTVLYGGWISVDGSGAILPEDADDFSGNTLNLHSQIAVAGVQKFEFYNFELPEGMKSGDTLLTVTGTAAMANAVVNVDTSAIDMQLEEGDSYILVSAGTSLNAENISGGGSGRYKDTATLVYDWELEVAVADRQLLMNVTSVRASDESKIFSEGFLAGSILLNQTGDMIAQRTEQARCGTFLDFTGGSSRYNTGSHIDMKGFSLLTGLTRCVNTTSGKMTYGAFFEYGNGNDTGLYVTGARGNSDVEHYGGGLLGRLNLHNSVYAEGSFRAGVIDNGFTSNLLDIEGNAASYDSSSAYVGTHIGLGRKLKLSSRNTWDVYGKYFWTHQSGDSVTLSTNDPVKFASIDSHRIRLGGRNTSAVNRRVSTYWGAAWEHEFAGTAKATTYGYDIDSPSLRGSTGIGELGMSLKAQRALPLALDLGVQGYVGKREGVAGSLQVRWAW